jgi:predicted enzyme related to lactoylglutathione lyase
MGKRESYAPGTFCSVDLATTDSEGAKAFYGGLFGWEGEDVHPGEGMTYTILRLNGDAVGGLFEREGLEEAGGPHWISYVSTDSADDVARRAAELGGETVEEPFDILDVGRMTAIKDPTGSGVAVWQARTYAGAGRVNEPGFLTWNELATNDTGAAIAFYEALFGWSTQPMSTGVGPEYNVVRLGERGNGGIRSLSPSEEQAGLSPYWFPYFAVESLEATFERCEELGGAKLFGPMEFPAGQIGGLRDPQGAIFAIWEGELED